MIQIEWKGDYWLTYDLQRAMTAFRIAARNAHFCLVAQGQQETECFACHAGEWLGIQEELDGLGLRYSISTWLDNSIHFSVGKTLAIADSCAKAIGDRGSMGEAGRLLGYPDCCVQAFSQRCQAGQSHLFQAVMATPGAHEDKQGIHVECFPECWPLSGLLAHELSFIHPCNLQCEGVRDYVRRTLAMVDPLLVRNFMDLIEPTKIAMLPGLTVMETSRLKATFTQESAERLPAGRNAVIVSVDIQREHG